MTNCSNCGNEIEQGNIKITDLNGNRVVTLCSDCLKEMAKEKWWD